MTNRKLDVRRSGSPADTDLGAVGKCLVAESATREMSQEAEQRGRGMGHRLCGI